MLYHPHTSSTVVNSPPRPIRPAQKTAARSLWPRVFVLLCLLEVLSVASYAAGQCSAASFKVAGRLPAGVSPAALVARDFDGDGRLDLAVANNQSNDVSILLNDGAGGFSPPTNYAVGKRPYSISAGDFNGDGKADLVTTNSDAADVSVLLGTGAGAFGGATSYPVGQSPYGLAVGDFNGDGLSDIAAGITGGDDNVTILLSNGGGGFNTAAPLSTGGRTYAITLGQFNGDNVLDLAARLDSQTAVFIGNGSGGFDAGSLLVDFGALATGDFNSDGRADLVGAPRYVSGIAVAYGNGAGNFSAATVFDGVANGGGIGVGDYNGDGKADVATLDGNANVSVQHGDGAGRLGTPTLYGVGDASNGIAAADFNADGKPDLAVASGVDAVALLYGTTGGEFVGTLNFRGGARPDEIVRADFNRDGYEDVAVNNVNPNAFSQWGEPSVSVLLGDGAGRLVPVTSIQFPGNQPLTALVTADFNNDGKADLAVAAAYNSADAVNVLLGQGDGTFATPNRIALSAYGDVAYNLDTADLNRDGLTDIIVAFNNSGNFVTLRNTGGGGFAVMPDYRVTGGNFYEDFAVGDFNLDANPDIVFVRYHDKSLTILFGNGSGYFNTRRDHALPGNPQAVSVQDFNRDGKADVAFAATSNFKDYYISIRLGDGAGGFGAATDYNVGSAVSSITAADFNGDTLLDLAVSNPMHVSVLTGDGAGGFGLSVPFTVWGGAVSSAAADFNRDGKIDLAVARNGGNSIAMLLNDFVAALPCLSVNDVTVTEGDAGATDAVFNVTLSEASSQTVTINFRVEPHYIFVTEEMNTFVSTAGVDYQIVRGTLTFAPGTTTQTISVPVNGDLNDEYDEAFAVYLSSPTNAAAHDPLGIGTILDNDAPPSVSINDVSVAEGATRSNPKTLDFTITLSAASAKTIALPYQVADGTATLGSDYQYVVKSINFSPGTSTQTFSVEIIGDATHEPDETFFVNLGTSPKANVVDGQGQGTILNDDPLPTISIFDASAQEGNSGTREATLQLTLSNASSLPITVNYATADGTAAAGNDYVAASGSITFNPGELSKSLKVSVNGDAIDEIDETFNLALSGATNASIGRTPSVVTIFDDDGPKISVNDISVTEGDFGFREARFTVTLSEPSPQFVSVGYGSTMLGTAVLGSDYRVIPSDRRLSFLPGTVSSQFIVQLIGDTVLEPDETFDVGLHIPSGGTIGDGFGTCTILNDDNPGTLQFSAPSYTVNENAGFATYTINRVGGSSGHISVYFSTESGTASWLDDYMEVGYIVEFNHGETSKTNLIVPLKDDGLDEEAETFTLNLSRPTNGALIGSPAQAVMTILDDDTTCVESISPSNRTSPATGEQLTVNVTAPSGCSWTAFSNSFFMRITSGASGAGNGVVTLDIPANGSGVPRTATVIIGGQTLTITQPEVIPEPPTLQFGAASYAVGEQEGRLSVPVTLTGGSVGGVSVDYRTVDTDAFTTSCADAVNNNGGAFARCDFAITVGRLEFAAGETQKTINIPVINDGHDEAAETFQIVLSNARGVAVLGNTTTATLVIQDDDPAGAPNPINTTGFFVRQHYLDFLSREPEPDEPWSAVLDRCPDAFNFDPASPAAACDRLLVSQSFFASPESRTKGFYVFRFYKLAFARLPEYAEVVSDMSFVAGATPAEVYARKALLSDTFVARPEFITAYGALSHGAYVQALMGRYGLTSITTPDPQQPDGEAKVTLTHATLVNRLETGALTRAQVLRAVADSDEVSAREFDGAFVAMQYYGYLRRTPEPAGYEAWLAVLRRGDIRTMVNGFLNSAEYKLRFGRL